MYLLDTNVVSELRRVRPHGGVLAWLGSVASANLHLAAVTLGEMQAGLERTRERDPDKAAAIEGWLELLPASFTVLPMGGPEFRAWARRMHRRSADVSLDAMIAATAEVHDLTVVTRNVRDFKLLGAATLDPFATPRG